MSLLLSVESRLPYTQQQVAAFTVDPNSRAWEVIEQAAKFMGVPVEPQMYLRLETGTVISGADIVGDFLRYYYRINIFIRHKCNCFN